MKDFKERAREILKNAFALEQPVKIKDLDWATQQLEKLFIELVGEDEPESEWDEPEQEYLEITRNVHRNQFRVELRQKIKGE